MTQPEKSCYSGIYKTDKKFINGDEMEKISFDSNTGTVTCFAEDFKWKKEHEKMDKKSENVTLWLAIIAIEILLCLLVAGI